MEVCWTGEGQALRIQLGGAGWVVGPGCQEDARYMGVFVVRAGSGATRRTSNLKLGPAACCLWIYVG